MGLWTTCSSGGTNRRRKLVFIDGQTDGQTNGQTQTDKSSENLFVPFSHQTICSSSSVKTAKISRNDDKT